MKCFANCGRDSVSKTTTLCVECSFANGKRWAESRDNNAKETIAECQIKIALCDEAGWFPWTPQEARDWFLSQWPEYSPKKEYEQHIYSIQRDMQWPITVPRHINICPCTLAQGKIVNAKFEKLTGA